MQPSVIFLYDLIIIIFNNLTSQDYCFGVNKDKQNSCVLLQRSAEGSSAEDGEGKSHVQTSHCIYWYCLSHRFIL